MKTRIRASERSELVTTSVQTRIRATAKPFAPYSLGAVVTSSFDHNELVFKVPAGQGANLPITVNVTDQVNAAGPTFSYAAPNIANFYPRDENGLETDTRGGRPTNYIITIVGTNFGVQSKQWSIILEGENDGDTDVSVPNADIVSWSHEQIKFYVPEGQGRNKKLVLTVGNQVAVSDEELMTCGNRQVIACFSYKPPVVYGLNPVDFADTQGGYPITLVGTSFGINGAVVTISDPRYVAGHVIDGGRMGRIVNAAGVVTRDTNCAIISQDHTEVVCTAPQGLGSGLEVKMTLEGVFNTNATFSYAQPEINFVVGSKSGDASGSEMIRIFGENFGPWRTAVNMTIGEVLCENAFWTNDDPMFDFEPYLKCASSSKSYVGQKNVNVQVAFSESAVFDR